MLGFVPFFKSRLNKSINREILLLEVTAAMNVCVCFLNYYPLVVNVAPLLLNTCTERVLLLFYAFFFLHFSQMSLKIQVQTGPLTWWETVPGGEGWRKWWEENIGRCFRDYNLSFHAEACELFHRINIHGKWKGSFTLVLPLLERA